MTDEVKIKLLILDDELGILEFMKRIFELRGFEVFVASTAEEALSVFEKESPDICVLDVYLNNSVMDGVDVLKKIRSVDENVICILFTQSSDPEVVERVNALSVYEYVNKMCDTNVVKKVIGDAAEIVKKRRGDV